MKKLLLSKRSTRPFQSESSQWTPTTIRGASPHLHRVLDFLVLPPPTYYSIVDSQYTLKRTAISDNNVMMLKTSTCYIHRPTVHWTRAGICWSWSWPLQPDAGFQGKNCQQLYVVFVYYCICISVFVHRTPRNIIFYILKLKFVRTENIRIPIFPGPNFPGPNFPGPNLPGTNLPGPNLPEPN